MKTATKNAKQKNLTQPNNRIDRFILKDFHSNKGFCSCRMKSRRSSRWIRRKTSNWHTKDNWEGNKKTWSGGHNGWRKCSARKQSLELKRKEEEKWKNLFIYIMKSLGCNVWKRNNVSWRKRLRLSKPKSDDTKQELVKERPRQSRQPQKQNRCKKSITNKNGTLMTWRWRLWMNNSVGSKNSSMLPKKKQ